MFLQGTEQAQSVIGTSAVGLSALPLQRGISQNLQLVARNNFNLVTS